MGGLKKVYGTGSRKTSNFIAGQAFPLNSVFYEQQRVIRYVQFVHWIQLILVFLTPKIHQKFSAETITNRESTHAILIAYRLFVFG